MGELVEIFIGAMVVGFSGALTPGPMLTLVISSSAEKGFWTSFFIVVGHALLELLVVAAFFLGLIRYLENPLIAKVIGIVGGVFLLYLGVDILVSVARKKFQIDFKSIIKKRTISARSSGIIVLKGVLVSLMNPYWYIWWMSIGAAFIIKSVKFDAGGVTAFFTGHISADFIWYLFIGFLISTGRKFMNQKVYNGILIACSIFLFYLGIKFIVDALM